MEDSHIAHIDIPGGNSLFGVYDGHGGQEVALFVKKHFKNELIKLPSYKSKCYKEALEEVFLKMDEIMETKAGKDELAQFQSSDGHNAKSFAGCTATVVLVTKTEIICANAGDSRTVMSKNGVAVELSYDHKPDDPVELKRIQNAGGFVEESRVNGMLALSRALGDFEYKNNPMFKAKDQAVSPFPDVKIVPITADSQFILLACDGIWDVKTSQEGITHTLKHTFKNNFAQKRTLAELTKGMEILLDDCCAKDLASSEGLGCDNMTADRKSVV